MSKIQTLRDDVQEKIFLRNSLDAIYKSVNSETSILTSDGKIKAELLDVNVGVANGTASGIVYNADTSRLTITNGGLQVNVQTNIGTASATAEKAKVPTAGAVQSYISSANVIPTSAVTDLGSISSTYVPLAENGWTRYVSAGAGVTVTTNSDNFPERDVTIALKDYDTIETATTGATVTIAPGKAYKIYATTSSKTLAISSYNDGLWGRESHIELFVAGTGLVKTGAKVVLTNSLEPDSVNNCTVRFHDGLAIISVEDHVAGYIVTVNAASGAGSLKYGLATATNEYISVDASLNGQTLNLAGVTTSAGEKHVVGNGYAETIVSGGITCTSKTTFSNLTMLNVTNSGGTMTLGDVNVPSGSTVAVSGGDLAIEKVTGDGGTIDLGNTKIVVSNYAVIDGLSLINGAIGTEFGCYVFNSNTLYLSDVNIDGGSATNGGVVHNAGTATLSSGAYTNNTATYGGVVNNFFGTAYMSECIANSNTAGYGGVLNNSRGTAYVSKCIASSNTATYGGVVYNNGTATLSSGAYTNNTATNGGVLFNSAGTAYVSKCIASSNSTTNGGAFVHNVNASCTIVSCTISSNTDNGGFGAVNQGGATAVMNISSSIVVGNTPNDVRVNGGTLNIDGSTVSLIAVSGGVCNIRSNNTMASLSGTGGGSVVIFSGASIALTSSIAPGGTGKITVSGGAVTINGNSIPAGKYTRINSNGSATA